MTKQLTQRQKLAYLPILINRDGGLRCFYCHIDLQIERCEYDHLNDDDTDNRPENLVTTCHSCNLKKRDNYDMKIIALEKLKQNESLFIAPPIEDKTSQSDKSELEISHDNYDIAHQYLIEVITTDGKIEYPRAVNNAAYLCKQKTGFGSPQAIRNYFDMLTCDYGPFMVEKDAKTKKRFIERKQGN